MEQKLKNKNNLTTARLRVLYFIENQNIKKLEFLNNTGLKRGFIDRAHAQSGTSDLNLSKIIDAYPSLSAKWLLTGEGAMINEAYSMEHEVSVVRESGNAYNKKSVGIPLVDKMAVAGFWNSDFNISELDVKDRYIIPKFQHRRIDFMLEVTGSSMYPKYRSGDVIGCTILHDTSFIQWNRAHLIGTSEQGLLLKRLRPGTTDESYTAISDHKDYPPFEIPKSEIKGLALVAGTVRLE